MVKVYTLVGFLIVILVIAAHAGAQGTADIVGRVTDASGAAISNANVTARDVNTNVSRNTVTSDTGDYTFPHLPIGTYEVKTGFSGFKTETSRITLVTGDRARVDVKLAVGQITETVEVQSATQQLQTDSAQVASDIGRTLVQNQPVINRNITQLVQLMPGAAEGNATATISGNRPDDRRESSAVAIDGMPENENRQMIDGVDNEERVMGGMGIKPSLEAIQEVNVLYNSYSADNGRTLGAVINLVTKSGTNSFHGSAYEYFRNSVTDAQPYFSQLHKTPPNHQNQFGGSMGGPLKHDRTFFFGDYDQQRVFDTFPSVITVPTVKMHSGDFSELLPNTIVYNPYTSPRTQFMGNGSQPNVIPSNLWDARAINLMAMYPTPTNSALANNFAYNGPQYQINQTGDIRIDQTFNPSNTLFGRFSFNLTSGSTASQCPDVTVIGIKFDPLCNTGGTVSLYSGPYVAHAYSTVENYTHIFSPSVLFSTAFNYFRPLTTAVRDPVNPFNAAAELGYQNINYANDPITGGLPWFQMNPTSYGALGDPTFIPMTTADGDWQTDNALTVNRGAHSFKFGGGVVFRRFGVQQSQYPRSTYIFGSGETNNGSGKGGNTFASLLLGVPDQEQRIHFPITPLNRSQEYDGYAQDNWRTTRWLTLNLGMRYEIFTPITEAHNNQSAFNPTTGKIDLATSANPTVDVQTDYSDWGPRFGFAATLPHKFVFRGGYGIVYDPILRGAGSYNKNAPFTENFGPYINNAGSGGTCVKGSDANGCLTLEDNPPPLVYNSVTNPAGTLGTVTANYKVPRNQEYNITLEKEIGGFVITAAYIGYHASRYPLNVNLNLPPIEPTPAGGTVNNNRPYFGQYPGLTTITMITSLGERTYNSGALTAAHRYSSGLAINSSLTWGHAMEDILKPWAANDQPTAGALIGDPTTSPLEWGDTPVYDIRMKWVAMATYDLPFGRGMSAIPRALVGGWQMNVLTFWSTGIDFGIYDGSSQTNQGLGAGSDEAPNLVAGCNPNAAAHTVTAEFNTSCFTVPAKYNVGNVGLGTMHGPPQRQLNVALAKKFYSKGERTVDFRAESYNLTNTPSFQPPDGNLGDTTFGVTSSIGNMVPRQFQFSLKYLF